jgi:subtilisin family serine protease
VALDESAAHIKVDPSLSTQRAPLRESRGMQRAPVATRLIVELWPEADIEAAQRSLADFGKVERVSPNTRKIELVVPNIANIGAIAKLKSVKYVAPSYGVKSQNTHVAKNMGVEVAAAAPQSLTGRNVKVGIWDEGHVAQGHPSFKSRLSVMLDRERVARHDMDHATHVAGTIAGSGEYVLAAPAIASEARGAGERPVAQESSVPAGPEARNLKPRTMTAALPALSAEPQNKLEARYPGMAPAAQLLSFDFADAAEELISLLDAKPDALDLMNNSWGLDLNLTSCSVLATYNALSARDFDSVVSGQTNGKPVRRIPIVFSAGNTRNDGICGLSTAAGFVNYRTITPPGTAKNVITVGAIDADSNAMTEFSAWGPTSSGRLKPDVVAPGCRVLDNGQVGILSMSRPNSLMRDCGTSMAAPAVTGVLALMVEKMEKLGLAKASVYPSTYKALLIHGAQDLGRPGPDFEYGYGRVQLPPTLKLMDGRAFQQLTIAREGEVQTREITVSANARELKVTLVWDDKPLGVFVEDALSNDLDLVLVAPNGTQHLPMVLNSLKGREAEPARPGADHVNVVEQVLVKQPAAGVWRIQVRAFKMGSPTGGQTYSLVSSAE